MNLRIRLFTASGTLAMASRHAAGLRARLGEFQAQALEDPQPYPKFEGWYEHYFDLQPATEATFDRVLSLVPAGWQVTRDGECDAVWNPEAESVLLMPCVRWAQLLLVS